MKTKEYSYDSEGHIKYWYNRSSHSWEVFDTLNNDYVGFGWKNKKDAVEAAHYHYDNGVYGFANGNKNKPVKRSDLSSWTMINKNEKKFTKITRVDGKKFDWVGFGWIEVN